MLKGKPITVLRQFGDETTWNCRIPQHYIAHFWPICISPRLLRLWRVASTAARSSDNRLKQPAMRRNSATRTMSSYGSTNKHLLGMHTHIYIYIHNYIYIYIIFNVFHGDQQHFLRGVSPKALPRERPLGPSVEGGWTSSHCSRECGKLTL